jgi:hypothetical protein
MLANLAILNQEKAGSPKFTEVGISLGHLLSTTTLFGFTMTFDENLQFFHSPIQGMQCSNPACPFLPAIADEFSINSETEDSKHAARDLRPNTCQRRWKKITFFSIWSLSLTDPALISNTNSDKRVWKNFHNLIPDLFGDFVVLVHPFTETTWMARISESTVIALEMSTKILMRDDTEVLERFSATVAQARASLDLPNCFAMCFKLKMVVEADFALYARISTRKVTILLVFWQVLLELACGSMLAFA